MIEQHEKAVLQFSGGKDSLCCLHLLREHWEKITVLWVNTGAAFPETVKQMAEVRAMVPHFLEVESNQPYNLKACGWPSDIVPHRNTTFGALSSPEWGGPRIQDSASCCGSNIWFPMAKATEDTWATLIIRGQRNTERRRAPIKSGHVERGVTYWFPIEDWSSEKVKTWLCERGIPLPSNYAYFESSLDCWSCTAYLDDNDGKMRYLRDHHPEKHETVIKRLCEIQGAVSRETQHLTAALEA